MTKRVWSLSIVGVGIAVLVVPMRDFALMVRHHEGGIPSSTTSGCRSTTVPSKD